MANSQENSRGSLLVTVEELLALGSDCLVVDARPFKEFQRGHIPGAVHIGWEDWNEKAPTGSDRFCTSQATGASSLTSKSPST